MKIMKIHQAASQPISSHIVNLKHKWNSQEFHFSFQTTSISSMCLIIMSCNTLWWVILYSCCSFLTKFSRTITS